MGTAVKEVSFAQPLTPREGQREQAEVFQVAGLREGQQARDRLRARKAARGG